LCKGFNAGTRVSSCVIVVLPLTQLRVSSSSTVLSHACIGNYCIESRNPTQSTLPFQLCRKMSCHPTSLTPALILLHTHYFSSTKQSPALTWRDTFMKHTDKMYYFFIIISKPTKLRDCRFLTKCACALSIFQHLDVCCVCGFL